MQFTADLPVTLLGNGRFAVVGSSKQARDDGSFSGKQRQFKGVSNETLSVLSVHFFDRLLNSVLA